MLDDIPQKHERAGAIMSEWVQQQLDGKTVRWDLIPEEQLRLRLSST